MKTIIKTSILLSAVMVVAFFAVPTVSAAQNPTPPTPSQCAGAAWYIGLPDGITCTGTVTTAGALEGDAKAASIFGTGSRLRPDLVSLNQFCRQYTGQSTSYAKYASAHNYCNGCDQNLSWWTGSSWVTNAVCHGTQNIQGVQCATGCGPTCTSHASQKCVGNAVYWFNSCGTQQELAQTCSGSQVCQNNQCVNIACNASSDCGTNGYTGDPFCQSGNVYQNYKTYTCNNPGTASASCTSASNAQLKQTCASGQTCSGGSCANVACNSNTDCGTSGYIDNPYCQSNDVYQIYKTYTCNNAGTASAYCSNNSGAQKKTTCGVNQVCQNGQCINQNITCSTNTDCGTNGYTGDPYCQNNKVYQNYKTYTCSNPGTGNSSCSNQTSAQIKSYCTEGQTCEAGQCKNIVITCSSNSQCGTSGWVGNPTCQNGDVYQDYKTYTCSNPGTGNSSCSNTTEFKKKSDCTGNQTCNNGSCVNIVCNTNTDCGDNAYVDSPSCYNGNVWQNYKTWTCSNGGTASAYCSNKTEYKLKNTCSNSQTCSGGSCEQNNLSVSCQANPNPAQVGQQVAFTAAAAGGSGIYTYSWTGACTGSTSKNCYNSFSQTGNRSATITVASAGQTTSSTCSVDVSQSCTPNASQRCVGSAVYWFDSCGQQGGLIRTCLQNQTCDNGNCVNPTITCSSNSQCGTNGYVDSPICQGNDVWQNYKTYTCNNAGTTSSSCSNTTELKKKTDCTANQTCSNGSCNEQNITCSSNSQCGTDGHITDPYCKGNDVYKKYRTYTCNNAGTANSYCSNSDAEQKVQDCGVNQTCSNGSCNNQNIACSSNSECGTDVAINSPYCQNNKVYQNYKTYTCNSAGTASSYCSNSTESRLQTTCTGNQTCSNGNCGNSCTDNSYLQCNGNNLYWYSSCGTQQDFYQSCPNGCSNGSCQNNNSNTTVQTNSATNTTSNSATLNGSLTVNGSQSNCNNNYVWFRYGPNSSYGTETNHMSQNYSGSFSQAIYNLNYNEVHFQAVAQTCSGSIVYGQDMVAYLNGQQNGYLTMTKTVKNLTTSSGFANSVYASPSDMLMFMITLQASGNQNVQNVVVRDNLPANLSFNSQLVVACSSTGSYSGNCSGGNYNYSGNISTGINLNTIYAGQTVTITYQVQLAQAQNFSYGTTTLTNSAYATSSNGTSPNASAQVMVTRTAVYGASSISTGLTNNFLVDSFFLPMLLAIMGILMWRSGAFFGVEKWMDDKKKSYKGYKSDKELASRIASIQKMERV
jgi:uncharacterized repeat protein (TIGR01451 family)